MSKDAYVSVRGRVVTIDLGHHLLRDLSNPVRIRQVVHPRIRYDFAPVASVRVAAESGAIA